MFILEGWRKDQRTEVIAINKDKNVLKKLMDSLFVETGLEDYSEGMWDRDEIKGIFSIKEIDDETDPYQRAVDFLNYQGQFKIY
jgi:hypothetical protein